MSRRAPVPLVALVAVAALVAACSSDADGDSAPSPAPSTSTATTPEPTSERTSEPTSEPTEPGGPDLDLALSETVEDSVYPEIGDPGVDALHYDLDLTWDPESDTLTGHEILTFRSTADAEQFQLDFSDTLDVTSVAIDGTELDHEQRGKDLVVTHPVATDERYVVEIRYQGTPEPVDAPTTRGDFSTTGFTIDDEHQAWTMQEPYGAFTWYAVNDQPADKALYDFTLQVPTPWTGVANGEQVGDEDLEGVHRTRFHLAEPASSYLVTMAFGDYDKTEDTGPGGLPITYWTPAGDGVPSILRGSPDALAWLEERLGPYPFDTAGILVVDSESGMETQTMITISPDVSDADVLHEYAHHWYGDQVTPSDWRDVWMNEGMATYLQFLWQAEQVGVPIDDYLDDVAGSEARTRAENGPPGDFDPGEFAAPNVYLSGAFLWHALRLRVGEEPFWKAVRGWPLSQDNQNADRDTLLAYLEEQTGEDLGAFWDAWLLGDTTPPLS
ncbi:M1 family metallopeptidase [Nocardioides sp.]|uniref:M1 family metallopeptidase n=1 Tax=Nocardioides sp. TaxID=35761 RepID=UPI0027195103|nr:M1 family metallopeptidase [Nocardioides sp.]MDO9455568.1 M1 family metallopeptidase [Nocardioides sp.]